MNSPRTPADESAQLFSLLDSIRLVEMEALIHLRNDSVLRPWTHPDVDDEYFELVMQGLATREGVRGRIDLYRITDLGLTFLAFAEMVLSRIGVFLRFDRDRISSQTAREQAPSVPPAPSPSAPQKQRATLSLVPSNSCAAAPASAPTEPK